MPRHSPDKKNEAQTASEPPSLQQSLIAGGLDAVGFVCGVLLAYAAAAQLGWNVFAPGYDGGVMVGILLCGLGGGVGVQLARKVGRRWILNGKSNFK